jgi:hypothetical protein
MKKLTFNILNLIEVNQKAKKGKKNHRTEQQNWYT